MKYKKILVTGGAGYVGSVLVPLLLAEGHGVRVLDNLTHGGQSLLGSWSHPRFEFVKQDIRDTGKVLPLLADSDAVVHLAAIVGDPACARMPELARSVNLDASLKIFEEAGKRGVKAFVFASTCSNYGKMRDHDKLADETSELRPLSLYAETKVAVEKAVLGQSGESGMCATSLRFATVYGVSPRMRFDLTVNEFTMEMLTKKRLVIYGGQFWRPYAHVMDIARSIKLVLESPEEKVKGQVFNVGSTGQNYQKRQLVDMIKPHAPGAVVEEVHKEEDPRDYKVSFEKIKERLGFEITRTVEDGIRDVAWIVNNGVIRDVDDPMYRN